MGLYNRHSYINLSQEAELYIRIWADPFNVDRYLLNNVNIQLRLTPHKPEFFLVQDGYAPAPVPPAAQGPKVNLQLVAQITHAEIYVPRVFIKEKALREQEAALTHNPALYAFIQYKVHYFNHLPNTVLFDNQVVNGILPTRIYVIMMEERAYLGDFKKNPLNFGHFKLGSIQVNCAGRDIPANEITMDWPKRQFSRAYNALFEALANVGAQPQITRDDFSAGYFITCINCTLDQQSSTDSTYTTPLTGALRLKMKFDQPHNQTLAVLVVCEFEKLMTIDKDRKINITDAI